MGRWSSDWPSSVHVLGVGGVAMSALAEILKAKGVAVRGSDRAVYPPVSEILLRSGIEVRTPYAASNLDPAPELVVVGNAISRGNPELERALDEDLPLASFPEVVERLLVPGRRVTVVAGTHGKTTTSSMVAYLHHAAGRDPSFIVGGRPGNFESGGRLGEGPDLVLEGDEYDTAFFDKNPKFLHYWPEIGVLGPVEFDHADIYADLAAVERAFTWYVRLLPARGTLVVHADDERARRIAGEARCRIVTTGLSPEADVHARDRLDHDLGQSFTVHRGGETFGTVRLAVPGPHNARNALAALAAAEAAGLPLADGVRLLEGFAAPRRRLELIARKDDVLVYDDFAHHPTAIAETLRTLRPMVPAGGRLVACVEPRSNTMVRSLVRDRLLDALAGADWVLLGGVDRPERFAAEERLDVAGLAAALADRGVSADGPLDATEMAARLLAAVRPGDRVVLMSNGAFGGLGALLRGAFEGAGS